MGRAFSDWIWAWTVLLSSQKFWALVALWSCCTGSEWILYLWNLVSGRKMDPAGHREPCWVEHVFSTFRGRNNSVSGGQYLTWSCDSQPGPMGEVSLSLDPQTRNRAGTPCTVLSAITFFTILFLFFQWLHFNRWVFCHKLMCFF